MQYDSERERGSGTDVEVNRSKSVCAHIDCSGSVRHVGEGKIAGVVSAGVRSEAVDGDVADMDDDGRPRDGCARGVANYTLYTAALGVDRGNRDQRQKQSG